ncbi:hypothetical protein Tco_0818879, partial [Tanacetum coccineum]
ELMIKERDVKQGWENEYRLNEFEMQKQYMMIQKSKCNSSKEKTNAGDGNISKDASEIDNNNATDSHDKDNITNVTPPNWVTAE